MQHQNWQCPKCGNREFEAGQVSGTGGIFSKFFNIQTQRFTTVTCSKCTYTEMYKGETGTLEMISLAIDRARPGGMISATIYFPDSKHLKAPYAQSRYVSHKGALK